MEFVDILGHLSPVKENLRHLRSFQEAVNIDANFAAEKDVSADRLLHTKYLLNILFERMLHVVEYYRDDTVDHTVTEGGSSWEDYAAMKPDSGDSAIRDAAKDGQPEFVTALRIMKRATNLLDAMFVNNILWVIEQMDPGVEEISDVGEEFREFFGFSPNDRAIGTPGDFMCRLQGCDVGVSIADCFAYRPVQEKIHVESPVPYQDEGLAGTLRRESSGSVTTRLSANDVRLQLVR